MTILVAGATGTVGSQVLHSLSGGGADVRALTRSPDKAKLPAGVTAVQGDLGDVDSIRAAMNGVSTLFLVVANATDELCKAMLTLNVARDAKVKGIVYLSVFKAAQYADVPHFAAKATIEHMIDACDLPATILRPPYFFQNDAQQKDALLTHGVYGCRSAAPASRWSIRATLARRRRRSFSVASNPQRRYRAKPTHSSGLTC